MECGARHPENPEITCRLAADERHPFHVSGYGRDRVQWLNEDQPPAPPPVVRAATQPAVEKQTAKMLDMVRRVEPSRRSVGVLLNDAAARRRGSEEATDAVEAEFREAVAVAVLDLNETLGRWTTDDLWDLLEQRGHSTAHPKGMSGLLRSLGSQKIRAIQPVDRDDPDAYRRSNRTNESRLLRVYEPFGGLPPDEVSKSA